MALRRVAGTVTRRMLGGSSSFSGDFALARGSGGAGGSREWDRASVSRFWSFGGSKGGDDEDDGEDASRADHADADASGEGANGSGDASDAARASGRDASGADDASPWTRAMEDATRASSSAGDDAPAAPPSPEVTSPRWNVPDDPADPFAVAAAPPSGSGGDAPARAPRSRSRSPRDGDSPASAGDEARGELDARGRQPRDRASTPPAVNLYVKNLPKEFNAAKLAEIFLPHGDVQSAKFVANAGPVPTGLVRFSNPEDAARAMEALQGHKLGEDDEASRTVGMSVSLAMSKSERDARHAERRAAWEREKAERAERRRLWEERNAAWAAKQAERARRDARARDRVAIHVRNCPVGLEGDQLERIFAPFGTVSRARLFWPNGAKPSAVLTLDSKRAAEMAVATLDGVSLPGCRAPMEIGLHVPKANKKKKRGEESESESASASDAESESNPESNSESTDSASSSAALDPSSVALTPDVLAMAEAARAAAREISDARKARRASAAAEALARAKAVNADAAAKYAEELAAAKQAGRSKTKPSDVSPRVTPYVLRSRRAEEGVAGGARRRNLKHARERDASTPDSRVVAGPGVKLSDEAARTLAAAAERTRARGRDIAFGGGMEELRAFGGRGGGAGKSRGGSRGGGDKARRGSRRRSDADGFGRGAGMMERVDERTQAALDARIREAQELASGEEQWEWDPATYEYGARKTFDENFNAAEYASAPYVPGFAQPKRAYESEEELLTRNKAFIMAYSGIRTDAEFDSIKRAALERFAYYKKLDERQAENRGVSPIGDDFLAERATLQERVTGIHPENPLADFARRAVDTLDGNAGWSYERKTRALDFLARKAEKYQPGAEAAERS